MDMVTDHTFFVVAVLLFVCLHLRQIIWRRRARMYAYDRPAVFRNYYNYYLRTTYNAHGVKYRFGLASELAALPSLEVARKEALQESKKAEDAADAVEKEETEKFI
jgi:hypothetical protein